MCRIAMDIVTPLRQIQCAEEEMEIKRNQTWFSIAQSERSRFPGAQRPASLPLVGFTV